jgi:2-phosphoglycerate kinase
VSKIKDLKVKKRDESLESWSYDKLVTSINKSGVPIDDAERYAKEVQEWSSSNAKDGVISSVAIRDRVMEVIKNDYPAESDSYQAFKKG